MMNNPNQIPMNRGMMQPGGIQQPQRQMTPQQMQVYIYFLRHFTEKVIKYFFLNLKNNKRNNCIIS